MVIVLIRTRAHFPSAAERLALILRCEQFGSAASTLERVMETKFYIRSEPVDYEEATSKPAVRKLYDDDHARLTCQIPRINDFAKDQRTLLLIGGRDSLRAMLEEQRFEVQASPGYKLAILFSRAKSRLIIGDNFTVIQIVAYAEGTNTERYLSARPDFVPPTPALAPTTISQATLLAILESRLEK
jgi:hypothetical protein